MINHCLKEIEAGIKQYETVIRNLRQSNDELKSKIDWYETECENNEANLQKAYDEISELKKQLNENNTNITTIESVHKCNCENSEHEIDHQDLEKLVGSLRRQLVETGTKRKELEKQNRWLVESLALYKEENMVLGGEDFSLPESVEDYNLKGVYYQNQALKKMLLDTLDDYYSKGLLVDGCIYDKNRIRGMNKQISDLKDDCKYYRDDCVHRLNSVPHIYRNRINELEGRVEEQEQLIVSLQDDANIRMIKDYKNEHH